MNCRKCQQPMSIIGRHWICGHHDPPLFLPVVVQVVGTNEAEWHCDVVASFPFPLACAYQHLRDDILAHRNDRDALRQLILVKDCIETLVKYLAIIVISARLDRRDSVDAIDRRVLEKLVAPSLGTWIHDILQPLVGASSTLADVRLTPLVRFASSKFYGLVGEFAGLRNRVLGHGVVRDPREDREDVNTWLPKCNQLFADASFLSEWELVQATIPPRSWMGADALGVHAPVKTNAEQIAEWAKRPGEFLLITQAGPPISLFPFLYMLRCMGCNDADRPFVYDSQKQYTAKSKKVVMLENSGGHKEVFEDPASGLAERFPDDLILEYYRSHRRNFEVLEGKLAEFDFDSYRQRVQHFVGRKPVLKAIKCFLSHQVVPSPAGAAPAVDRGYFLLVAEPGLGKTALLTHWIDTNDICPLAVRFFWRRGRNLTRFDFLRHIYYGLLRKHNIDDEEPPKNEQDYSRKLDTLLKLISEKYLADGECEVIVIDGIDEAGDSDARSLALSAVPRDLPRHIYFLISSRPVRELDVLGRENRFLLRYVLQAETDWNKADVREYIELQLGSLLATGEMNRAMLPKIETAADGNFLWADQFCLSVRAGKLRPDAIEQALPRMQGLDSLYQEFWHRIIADLSAEEEACLWRVVGILTVARTALTAEQISRFAGIEDGHFIVTRSLLQQYLDEVELRNDLQVQAPLIGFRFYHTSFRDYLFCHSKFVPEQHHDRIVNAYIGAERSNNVRYAEWDLYGIAFAPFHAIHAKRWDQVEALLTDLDFIQIRSENSLVHELLGEYADALGALPEFERQRNVKREQDEDQYKYVQELIHHARGLRGLPIPPDSRLTLRRDFKNTTALPTSVRAARILAFANFIGENSQLLADFPKDTFTLAYNYATGSHVDRAAAKHVKDLNSVWIERYHRTRKPLTPSAPARTLRGHMLPINAVAISGDGKRAASGGSDGMLLVWDAEIGHERRRQRMHAGSVNAMGMTPDGHTVVTGGADGFLSVLDIEAGNELYQLKGHDGSVTALAVTPDAQRVISGGDDGFLFVWDKGTSKERRLPIPHPSSKRKYYPVIAIGITPDGRRAVSAHSCYIFLWDLESGCAVEVGQSFVANLVFAPDENLALICDEDGWLTSWRVDRRAKTGTFVGGDLDLGGLERIHGMLHPVRVRTVAITADGRTAVSGGDDGILRVWDCEVRREMWCVGTHAGGIHAIAVTPDGRQAITGGNDGNACLWEIDQPLESPSLSNCVHAVALAANGQLAISGDSFGLNVWDAANGVKVRCLEERPSLFLDSGMPMTTAVALSSNGRRAVTVGHHQNLQLWDVMEGRIERVIHGHNDDGSIVSVSISGDGRRAATGDVYGALQVWDLECQQEKTGVSKELPHRLPLGHEGPVFAVALSADGSRFVSSGADGNVRVWDVGTGCEVRPLGKCGPAKQVVRGLDSDGRAGHEVRTRRYYAKVYTPDLQYVESHYGEYYLRQPVTFPITVEASLGLGITVDRRIAVSGGEDGTLRLWNLDTGDEVWRIEAHEGPINAVAVSAWRNIATSGGVDGFVRVWDLDRRELMAQYGTPSEVTTISAIAENRGAICGLANGEVHFVRLRN